MKNNRETMTRIALLLGLLVLLAGCGGGRGGDEDAGGTSAAAGTGGVIVANGTIVISGFGPMFEARETKAGEARNSLFRRSPDVPRKRSEVLILLTPRILRGTAD